LQPLIGEAAGAFVDIVFSGRALPGASTGSNVGKPEKIRIGDLLVQQKLITEEQLRQGLEEQRRTGRKLGRTLVEKGIVTAEQVCEALARQFNIPFVNLKLLNIPPEVARKLPETQARRHRALVLEERREGYLVAMADPTDLFAYDEIGRILKRTVLPAVADESLVVQTIDRVYRRTEEISGIARELEQEVGEGVFDFRALSTGVSVDDAPVVRLLQTLFEDAVQVNASDIHIEPEERRVHIRFRIDGQLVTQTEADAKIGPALAVRLKIMAGLDISEKRLPQDGRFNVRVRGQQVDVRVSTLPVHYGESVVMRLLNQSTGLRGLDHIGMSDDMLARLRAAIHRTAGMVLVTGPTGSGKTTTLYAALSEINTLSRKIVTVEDPIEYRLGGISQVQVSQRIDLTFARVLRSVLRHDPDVVLVGEMRDEETAQIGLRAALTGHLVLSTLHTNDAMSTPLRLLDMGVPRYMAALSLRLVLAQRLIRVICDSCKQPHDPAPQEQQWLQAEAGAARGGYACYRGIGCTLCNGTGYHGRTGVYEMLEMSPEVVDAVNHGDLREFTATARRAMGGETLQHDAARLALEGRTTVEEAMRVAHL
jgi:MSHA biogenesis protein MshE